MTTRKGRKGKEVKSIKSKVKPVKKETINKIVNIEERKRSETIKDKGERGVPIVYGLLIIIVVAAIGAVLIFLTANVVEDQIPVKNGDIVQVKYTGTLQNGSVFDSGNHTFVVGSGNVIEGFDQAVVGMKRGETKTVTLSPDEAYGYYDESNVLLIPLRNEMEITENISIEVFNFTFGKEPVLNNLYTVEGMEWPLRVIEISNDTVLLRHEPENNQIVERSYGNDTLRIENEKLIIETEPEIGAVIFTTTETGIITWANETDMKIDFNSPFAGKTLTFKITILNVIPS